MNAPSPVRGNIEAIVIGASAGGIQALSEILPALPPTFERCPCSWSSICRATVRACWWMSFRPAAP